MMKKTRFLCGWLAILMLFSLAAGMAVLPGKAEVAADFATSSTGGAWNGTAWWDYWSRGGMNASVNTDGTTRIEFLSNVGNNRGAVNYHESKLNGTKVSFTVEAFADTTLSFFLIPSRTDASNPNTIPAERWGLAPLEEVGSTSPRPKSALYITLGLGRLNGNKEDGGFITVGNKYFAGGNAAKPTNALDASYWEFSTPTTPFTTLQKNGTAQWGGTEENRLYADVDLEFGFVDGALTLTYSVTPYSNRAGTVSAVYKAKRNDSGAFVTGEGTEIEATAAIQYDTEVVNKAYTFDDNAPYGGVTDKENAATVKNTVTVDQAKFAEMFPLLTQYESWENVLMGIGFWNVGNNKDTNIRNNRALITLTKVEDEYSLADDATMGAKIGAFESRVQTAESKVVTLSQASGFEAVSDAYVSYSGLKIEVDALCEAAYYLTKEPLRENHSFAWKNRLAAIDGAWNALLESVIDDGAATTEVYAKLLGEKAKIAAFRQITEELKEAADDATAAELGEIVTRGNAAFGSVDAMGLMNITEDYADTRAAATATALYAQYREILADYYAARDALCRKSLEEFEALVAEVGDYESASAAMSKIPEINIDYATTENHEEYKTRFDKAISDLTAICRASEGAISRAWSTYGLTWLSEGENGKVIYESYNGFADDPAASVGAILKEKVSIDGFSFKFKVTRATNIIGSWFAVSLVTKNEAFLTYEDATAGRDQTRGLVTFLVPYNLGVTEVQSWVPNLNSEKNKDATTGFPKLRPNDTKQNLEGHTVLVEWEKEETAYKLYITMTDDGGNEIAPRACYSTVTEAEVIEALGEEKTGYVAFGAWDQAHDGMAAEILEVNGVAAAEYQMPEELTVTYVVDGEAYGTPQKTVGYKPAIDTPEKEGYDFDGWYLDAAYTQKYDGSLLDEDCTLYGRFVERSGGDNGCGGCNGSAAGAGMLLILSLAVVAKRLI